MCKIGDIIVIDNYRSEDGKIIDKHSFIVINDDSNYIKGLKYDFVANVMSSFKTKEQMIKKLKYKENLILNKDSIINKKIKKASYVKADQLFYFDKSKINYYVLGRISDELLNKLVSLILELADEEKLVKVISNL